MSDECVHPVPLLFEVAVFTFCIFVSFPWLEKEDWWGGKGVGCWWCDLELWSRWCSAGGRWGDLFRGICHGDSSLLLPEVKCLSVGWRTASRSSSNFWGRLRGNSGVDEVQSQSERMVVAEHWGSYGCLVVDKACNEAGIWWWGSAMEFSR